MNAMHATQKNQMKPKQQNTHYETILDSIADGVFTIDLDFNITYFNQAAEKITGVSKRQALGQKCFDVFRANICQTACVLHATMQTGAQKINVPINLLNSQGDRVSASVSTSALTDEHGLAAPDNRDGLPFFNRAEIHLYRSEGLNGGIRVHLIDQRPAGQSCADSRDCASCDV